MFNVVFTFRSELSICSIAHYNWDHPQFSCCSICAVCILYCGSLFVFLACSFSHCIVYTSIYGFWLPFWYLKTFLACSFFFLAIVLSAIVRFTSSYYPFGIFKLFLYTFINWMICHMKRVKRIPLTSN